jgi:hypothetical protein
LLLRKSLLLKKQPVVSCYIEVHAETQRIADWQAAFHLLGETPSSVSNSLYNFPGRANDLAKISHLSQGFADLLYGR